MTQFCGTLRSSANSFPVRATTGVLGAGTSQTHQPTPAPATGSLGIRLAEASDFTDVEGARNTRESVAKVENIGVGHLDQLTGLGVREVEAAEETGRPVVEASDSNSYPQCAGLAQPDFFPRDTSSSYHVTTGR